MLVKCVPDTFIFFKVGDVVVIVMGSPVSAAGTTNLIKVRKLEG